MERLHDHLTRLGQSDVGHRHIAVVIILGLAAVLLVDAHYVW